MAGSSGENDIHFRERPPGSGLTPHPISHPAGYFYFPNYFFCYDFSMSDDPVEHLEANAFALALLLPAEWLRRDIRAAGGYDPVDEKATAELARRYGVSPTLMAFRIGMLFGQKVGKSHP